MSTDVGFWAVLAVIGPLVAGLIALQGRAPAIRAGLALGSLASLSAAVMLGRELLGGGGGHLPLGGWDAPLGVELRVDGLAVLMLGVTAVVGALVSAYSTAYFGDISDLGRQGGPALRGARYFGPLWLILWAALNGIYLSGDLFNLYVSIEILGLASAALVTLAVTSKATVAGMRYLIVSLVGSMLFLLGVALLYISVGTLSLATLSEAQPTGALAMVALAVMTVGLAAKTALVPLHGWLPPAHAAAPAPASALLSALVVKGSFYILLRLWVQVFDGGSEAGLLILGLLGGSAIVWGSLLAFRQVSLKRLIAYSTVAQIGYLFLVFPLLYTAQGGWSQDAWSGGVYHALSHAVAKAAMFLAAGSMTYAAARDDISAISGVAQRLPMSFFAFGLAGLSLAGIPPSGGFVSKWLLLRAAISSGGWGWAVLISGGGLLTLGYVLKVVRHAVQRGEGPESFRPVPARMEWAALLLALLSVAMGVQATGILSLLAPDLIRP